MLEEFITVNRDEIIRRCRAKVANRSIPPPSIAEIDHGVPLFLEQLTGVLQAHGSSTADISTDDFHTLNRCLDDAIAGAVTEFGRAQHQSQVDGESAHRERLGFFAHELRNLASTALVAFEVLKTGNVGVGGSTGAVLHRSLISLTHLIARSLDLLQNAFKFTKPRSTVTLRIATDAERVFFEVEDECGGLPEGDGAELFRPFDQRNADRTGLGLGLAFSRWAVEANQGVISNRNLPGKGCVFTVELPRSPVPTLTR